MCSNSPWNSNKIISWFLAPSLTVIGMGLMSIIFFPVYPWFLIVRSSACFNWKLKWLNNFVNWLVRLIVEFNSFGEKKEIWLDLQIKRDHKFFKKQLVCLEAADKPCFKRRQHRPPCGIIKLIIAHLLATSVKRLVKRHKRAKKRWKATKRVPKQSPKCNLN